MEVLVQTKEGKLETHRKPRKTAPIALKCNFSHHKESRSPPEAEKEAVKRGDERDAKKEKKD